MGLLAENKTRRKINKDPNNTKWTKDENTFGQKILRAQGWQPGQFLGAQDAPHSELHTAANASYIRVVLKDDMKGLGFSKSKEDEVTGLDVFQDLLSRLNGKTDDAIVEDQQARLAVKTHHFVEQRYGPMRFVYGGLLIGDEMKELEDKKTEKAETSSDEDVAMESAPTPKESKKRKASDEEEDESSSRDTDSKSKKRRKEERKLKEADSDDTKAKKKKEKKEKKDKSRKKSSAEASDDEDATDERPKKRKSKKDKSRSPEDSDEEKVKDKKSKKEKKEKKRRKKEEEAASTADSTPAASVPGTGVTTPSGTSTPRGSRNFVRSRFIAQKRQAVLDTKALNQIFMVKA